MTITTSSKDASKLFLDSLDKSENAERTAAIALFDQAIQKDPDFALAYLYRSFSGGGIEVQPKYLQKAVDLMDHVSEGERHLILYIKAFFDTQGPEQEKHITKLLELYPSDKRIQYMAGAYYRYARDNKKAVEHFKKATELDKNYAAPYNNLGYIISVLMIMKRQKKLLKLI